MKKLGLGLAAVLIAGGIYYFSAGSEKLAAAMKTEINAGFASLKSQGFAVENKELSPQEEHFVLSFDDPEKIAAYLTNKGAKISANDAKVLKGLKLGVDVSYLANAYSSVSFDVYPMTLPAILTENVEEPEEKRLLEQSKEMLAKKVFLMHVDVNKLGTGFKGYMKDIDETLQANETLAFTMNDLSFKGSIDNEKVSQLTQVLKKMTFSVANDMSIALENIQSDYKISGASDYDTTTSYSVESAKAEVPGEFDFSFNGLNVSSLSATDKELLNATVKTNIKQMHFKDKTQDLTLKSLTYNMDANNLPLSAIKKLETLDQNDEDAVVSAMQELLSQGFTLNISDLSVEKFILLGKELKGFKLNTDLALDKTFDFVQATQNPMLALASVDANLNLTLSEDLFALAAQAPQAMMLMMLIQPESVNGEKVYKAELKDGKVTVNGKPMM